jgi:hypothetical protein
MPDSISLEDALNQMMTISDNRTTQAVRVLFGEDNINITAQMLGMTNTLIQHRIGCAGDIKDEEDEIVDFGAATHHNETTLFDIGILYEKVAKDEVLTSSQYKDKFYSLMSNQSNSTFFKEIVDEEAKVLCLDPGRTRSFKNQIKFAWKGGSYDISGEKYRSVAGWIQLPFREEGSTELRDYTFGVYIDGATTLNEDFSIFTPAKELLRDEIRKAMETFKPPEGMVVRKGDGTAGNVGKIEIITLGNSRLVTAISDSDLNLKLIVWDVSASGNQVTRKGDNVTSGFPEGQIVDVSATALSENRLAVAVRDIDGILRLSIWDISADGQSVKKTIPGSDDELEISIGGDEEVTQIVTATPTESVFNVAITGVGGSRLIAAVSDGDLNLKLIV